MWWLLGGHITGPRRQPNRDGGGSIRTIYELASLRVIHLQTAYTKLS